MPFSAVRGGVGLLDFHSEVFLDLTVVLENWVNRYDAILD
jgi:hypothetical protein